MREGQRWVWCAVYGCAAVSTIALVQGASIYTRYFLRFRSQPHPGTPVKGYVVSRGTYRPGDSPSHAAITDVREDALRDHCRVLIVGDSLAVGVGCEGPLPTLPMAITGGLSDRWGGIDMEWQSLGIVGANSTQTRRLVERVLHHPDAHPFDVIVVVVGLNDLKSCAMPWTWSQQLSTPANLRSELEGVLQTVRSMAGPHVLLALPGLPYSFSTVFGLQPLATLFRPLTARWEAVKDEVAQRVPGVEYIHVPTRADVERRLPRLRHGMLFGDYGCLCAADQVHPSDLGYALWGDHIAEAIARETPHPPRKARGVRTPRDQRCRVRPSSSLSLCSSGATPTRGNALSARESL